MGIIHFLKLIHSIPSYLFCLFLLLRFSGIRMLANRHRYIGPKTAKGEERKLHSKTLDVVICPYSIPYYLNRKSTRGRDFSHFEMQDALEKKGFNISTFVFILLNIFC
jgi:hypothetical protein